jgi:BNR repeat-like domain/Secretion system C-terminal sorting domain
MKQNYCFLFLFILFSIIIHPQIKDITKLPTQNSSQFIKESACVWLTDNEIIIFYLSAANDTLYSTFSTDRGKYWNLPAVVYSFQTPGQYGIYLNALRTSSGRIIVTWSIYGDGMQVIFSDDKGKSWSLPQTILGVGGPLVSKRCNWLNLVQLNDGRIVLSFTPFGSGLASAYRESFDNGSTWSEEAKPINISSQTSNNFSITLLNDSLLMTVFTNLYSIYKSYSSDDGISWSEPEKILDSSVNKLGQKIAKQSDDKLLLVYTGYTGETGNDGNIYYSTSSDMGSSWSGEIRYTKYIGDDANPNISELNGKTFLSFTTERFNQNYQISYAILEETVETYTPPKIYNLEIDTIDYDAKNFILSAKIVDDQSVETVEVVLEDSNYIGEMYDDGQHNDGAANDSVFANTLPLIIPRYKDTYTFDVNKINLPLNTKGVIADVNATLNQKCLVLANDFESNTDTFYNNLQISGYGSLGKYDDIGFLFSSGFYVSGYVNGDLFANGVAGSSLVQDYQPGNVGSNPDNPLNVFYVVNKSDAPFGASWQRWKDAVTLGADFYDGDKNGIYNPVDKNWNGTWDTNEDMPSLVGDEIAWCVYNDGVPAAQRRFGVDPIGIEVQQTMFASNSPHLEDIIFIKYKITNTGLVTLVLDSVFFSPWDDTDLGDAQDDLGGCDTLIQSMFTYNDQDDFLYGNNPPAIFTTLLQGPATESNNSNDSAYIKYGQIIGEETLPGNSNLELFSFTGYAKSDIDQGDPRDLYMVWNYVHARDRMGFLLDPCDTLYGRVFGNVDCNQVNPMFWFSGDPVTQQGWLDIKAADDRKFSSIGPVKLEKDKPIEIILALIVGRGSGALNSITVARANVQRAIEEYESNFASMTYSPPPATNPINSYRLNQNYPNPFNPTTTIRYELPQDGVVTIDIYNILGQKVKTILNEFKKADRYEVTFNAAGLASGVYIYRLKVNDFIQTKKMVLLK